MPIYQIGDTVRFEAVFRRLDTGELGVPTGTPTITITSPDGAEDVGNAAQLGLSTRFYRDQVVTEGNWSWYGETDDADFWTQTFVASVQVGGWVENVDAAVSSRLASADYVAPTNTYQAKVWLTIDDDADRYAVAWYRDGEPLSSGVTVPKIQVVKVADETELIAETAMEAVADATFRYDESVNRIADGAVYEIVVTAVIDGDTRTWRQLMSRDAT